MVGKSRLKLLTEGRLGERDMCDGDRLGGLVEESDAILYGRLVCT